MEYTLSPSPPKLTHEQQQQQQQENLPTKSQTSAPQPSEHLDWMRSSPPSPSHQLQEQQGWVHQPPPYEYAPPMPYHAYGTPLGMMMPVSTPACGGYGTPAAQQQVWELRQEMSSLIARADEQLQRVRAESTQQYEQLRSENNELRTANARLSDSLEARTREGIETGVRATLDERNRTIAAIEARVQSVQAELTRQRDGARNTLAERTQAVETLEAQLGSMQSQLVTVLHAQLQQRDDVRKLAAGGLVQATPLSLETAEPELHAPVPVAASDKLVSTASRFVFGGIGGHREDLVRRFGAPRRSVAQEFAQNEGGMWVREFEYVTMQPARQLHHQPKAWQAGSASATAADADVIVRDEGHDGWTLDDFCSRPLARAAGLSRAEVAVLRLYTGPAHAPLQFFLRCAGSTEVLSCTGRPYYVHFGGDKRAAEPFLFVADAAHRSATGEERCARCRRPKREHSQQSLHDWSTSASLLCSAVEKLAMWSPPMTSYVAVREEGGGLPPSFLPAAAPDQPSRGAGVAAERGCLSATTSKQVALALSGGSSGRCTLLELAFDYATRGASVQWLSQYPAEDEVVYPPCTALTAQGVRQWNERRRVLTVQATLSSLRVRTETISSLDTDPSGTVHALASVVSQGVNGFGAGVSTGVARLWSGVAGSSPPPREAMPYDSGRSTRDDGDGDSACRAAISAVTTKAQEATKAQAAAERPGAQMATTATTATTAATPRAGAVTQTAPQPQLSRPRERVPLRSMATRGGAAKGTSTRPLPATLTPVQPTIDNGPRTPDLSSFPLLNKTGAPLLQADTMQRELKDELRQQRQRVARSEQVVERVNGAVDTPEPLQLPSDHLARFAGSGSGIGAADTIEAQRRAVLTINDALELIENPPPATSPEREKSAAELKVHRHLEAAENLIQQAAGVERIGASRSAHHHHPQQRRDPGSRLSTEPRTRHSPRPRSARAVPPAAPASGGEKQTRPAPRGRGRVRVQLKTKSKVV
jgi:hypothetical protein